MNHAGRAVCVAASLILMTAVAGCSTHSKSKAKMQAAYLAGQNAAFQQQLQAAQFSGITVVGQVQNPRVPWVAGLTLAQAIATANYVGSQEPAEIIITRNGESARMDASVLTDGTDVPLEIGDVVEIH